MKIALPRREPRTEVDMVPMINVAFLLLLFFLLLGRFGPHEALHVDPPRADAESRDALADPEMLLMDRQGRLALGREPLAPGALRARMARWQQAHPSAPLRLKADAQADAAQLIALLVELRDLGVAEVRLLTRPASGT